MPKEDEPLPDDRDILLSEIETLKRDIRRLKLEKDILEKTAEIVKKDPGVDPESLTNKEKAILIDALRSEHPLKELSMRPVLKSVPAQMMIRETKMRSERLSNVRP
jgi:hypothetical protein